MEIGEEENGRNDGKVGGLAERTAFLEMKSTKCILFLSLGAPRYKA